MTASSGAAIADTVDAMNSAVTVPAATAMNRLMAETGRPVILWVCAVM
jgi:hypothetical protein